MLMQSNAVSGQPGYGSGISGSSGGSSTLTGNIPGTDMSWGQAGAGAVGGILGGLGLLEAGGMQSNSSSGPWAAAQPYLQSAMSRAQQVGQNTPYYAGPNSYQTQAIQQQGQFGQQNLGVGSNVQQLGQDMAQGQFLSPESNPYLAQAMDAATQPVQERWERETRPQIQSGAYGQGAYTGSRAAMAETLGATEMLKNMANIRAQMLQQNYENERMRQMQSGALVEQGMDLSRGALGDIYGAGEQQMFHDDRALMGPRQNLDWERGIYGGLNESQSETTIKGDSPLLAGIKAAASIAGAAGGFGF